jgi:hypothetical protein
MRNALERKRNTCILNRLTGLSICAGFSVKSGAALANTTFYAYTIYALVLAHG